MKRAVVLGDDVVTVEVEGEVFADGDRHSASTASLHEAHVGCKPDSAAFCNLAHSISQRSGAGNVNRLRRGVG